MTDKIIIITAPSGSGKTTLVKSLLERMHNLSFSISACTRQPRVGEVDGKDYYFLSLPDFKAKIDRQEFLEWEMVYHGKYYGTLLSELERIWQNHQYPLIDIDVRGALNVKKQFKGEALSVFVKASSMEVLKERLQRRGTETPDSLQERLQKAKGELAFASEFDTILVNDDLITAKEELFQIVSEFLG